MIEWVARDVRYWHKAEISIAEVVDIPNAEKRADEPG